MTPGKTTVQRLQDYLSKQESNDAGYQFSCDLKEFKVQINIKEFDKFSFIVESLRVERSNDFESGPDVLRKQADFLKANLTYLLENLEVFEIDNLQSKAQLRSHIPEDDNSSLSYFEIMIEGRRAHAIVDTASEQDCDGIVLGSRGAMGWKRLMVGGISSAVIVTTPLPVLVVKSFPDGLT